jgi:hypothetical protein
LKQRTATINALRGTWASLGSRLPGGRAYASFWSWLAISRTGAVRSDGRGPADMPGIRSIVVAFGRNPKQGL